MSSRREFLQQAAGCALLPVGNGDPNMNDTDQMLINDVRKLERAVVQRKQRLDALEKQLKARSVSRLSKRPKRYSVEIVFDADSGDASGTPLGLPPAKEDAQLVDGGTVFYCAQVETSVRVVGQATVFNPPADPGQIVNLTRPYGAADFDTYRGNIIDFLWRIRDTNIDREWQNMEMPGPFLLSGSLSGLRLPVHASFRGGTSIAVEVQPTFWFVGNSTVFQNIQQVVVHVSFDGHEVRL